MALEKIAGNLGTEVALTFVGALSGSPLAALLPVLSNFLASTRQKQRIEEALQDIDATLNAHADALRDISDSQYKLINETILALLQTISAEKVRYLRNAVHNSLAASDILPQEAAVLSRVIRDISADEAAFLAANFQYQRVTFSLPSGKNDGDESVLSVAADSPEGLLVTGLISLGLLSSASPAIGDSGRFRFSPIVVKLLALLREPRSSQAKGGHALVPTQF
jgi:type II secretory pathway pseudopilin PulG